MNYNFILSGAAGRSDLTKKADMGSQGLLRLGQKRANDSLLDHTTASEVFTRRRLETDSIRSVPNGSHLSALSPWGNSSTTNPRFSPLVLGSDLVGGGSTELPILNHNAGVLSLPRHSRSARFAEMEAMAAKSMSGTKRLFDSLSNKSMHPSVYNAYTSENGFIETEYNRQQMFSVYARGLESMKRALGKDVRSSGEDATSQNAVKKFTLNGEQVDKITDTVSSEGLQEMPPPAPRVNTHPRGLYSSSPYFYETGSFGSDKVIPPYPHSTLSRGFYRSSFPDLCGNNSFLLGRNILSDPLSANTHISVGLKLGRHSNGSSTFFSLEATNAAMQEAMRNIGKSPIEAEASKSVLKAVSLRKKDRENSNIFPANVKSLLSTGIFDGVPVKYVSWDRTKNVRGTIQGTGYLCWCKDCKKLKMVNAYQLEQHAGSKSKHPNDHIYFSNGKSIYGVVQELKNTPSDKLLEVIPTVTGSGINNENFSKWKESFQAAGRELQRIFGSDLETGEASTSRSAVVPEGRE